ncbi:myo-inositol 2-dehydrogenase-like isoform X2 [Mytilus galloprovincialis]|uniref:myo-inositol 2-dehydrogenase-like isoform X2 n=1 Tax=Mytilus galloprovincialis TaxID=29158 RepID=UPI003F7C77F7
MNRIGAAIIGVGRIGQVHLKNMVNSHCIQVHWMVDTTAVHGNLKELANVYNLVDTKITTPDRFETVMADERVKMVVICVPTGLHKEFIMKSLKAGKHVFCEKPLCITVEDVKDCYGEAKRQGKTLLCALNRRFDKQFAQAGLLAKKGAFGKIRTVKMESRDNQTNLEYFAHNKGEEPEFCTAIGSHTSVLSEGFQSYGEYDTAMGLIKFKNGTLVHLDLNRMTCGGYQQSVKILGTKQGVDITNIRESQLEITDDKGTHLSPYHLVDGFLDRYLDSFAAEMSHFINVVKGEEECTVTGGSVIMATKLVYMLTEALQTGSKVYYTP